jgi:glycerol-3-phosphate acyltransferase PlsY
MNWLLLALSAYLLGAIPFGWILARTIRGVDVREHGSGNIGATNVLRVCGPAIGAPAFALDVLKGFAPVFWIAPFVLPAAPPAAAGALAAFAAVVGHTVPVYLRFKGGKGVATSAGALLALMPAATGVALVAFVLLALATRYVSVASTGAAVAIVAAHHGFAWRDGGSPYGDDLPATALVWAILALVVIRHRSNYVRLWNGTENRIGAKKAKGGDEEATEDG